MVIQFEVLLEIKTVAFAMENRKLEEQYCLRMSIEHEYFGDMNLLNDLLFNRSSIFFLNSIAMHERIFAPNNSRD